MPEANHKYTPTPRNDSQQAAAYTPITEQERSE